MSPTAQITWARREVARIEALPEADLILEVHNAVNGHTYSWDLIESTLCEVNADRTVYPGWNDICELKKAWEKFDSLTRDRQLEDVVASLAQNKRKKTWDPTFLRALLVNLRLIFIRAGVDDDRAVRLVHTKPTKTSESWLPAIEEGPEIQEAPLIGWSNIEDDEKTQLLQKSLSNTITHITIDSVFPAKTYNQLLIDHNTTEQAAVLELKSQHATALTKILAAHGLSNYVELHLLHRRFTLKEGEVMVHKTCSIFRSGDTSITVDIAKAVPCPRLAKPSLFPLMWMASSTGGLVAYEYGTPADGSTQPQMITNISQQTWDAFAQDFCAHVYANGLQDIASLKDKSCVTGGEYVIPKLHALSRIPHSIIHLQGSSELIETGWTVRPVPDRLLPFPEPTDGHVTKTRQTSGGTVAHYHVTTEDGSDAIDPAEADPVYTDRM